MITSPLFEGSYRVVQNEALSPSIRECPLRANPLLPSPPKKPTRPNPIHAESLTTPK
jgi:hypothetical protein